MTLDRFRPVFQDQSFVDLLRNNNSQHSCHSHDRVRVRFHMGAPEVDQMLIRMSVLRDIGMAYAIFATIEVVQMKH